MIHFLRSVTSAASNIITTRLELKIYLVAIPEPFKRHNQLVTVRENCREILNMSLFLALFVVVFLKAFVSADVVDDRNIARTAFATIHGKKVELHPGHHLPHGYSRSVRAFTRIPYAEPPLGDRRFAPPVPKVIQGSFDATRGPIACPQTSHPEWKLGINISEDCLYLDVFVPDSKLRSAAVMVWIHGGAYHLWAGSMPKQLPIPLAAFGDVIVVTCNYRLGPLGFMTTGDEEMPANIGLLDQRQVLLWVKDNIEAFGGDPSRVTIFGESAGSACVNLHLLSSMSAGLFSRAVLQSGAVGHSWVHHADMDEAVHMSTSLAKALGCDSSSSSEMVDCLREKPMQDFINIYGEESPLFHKYFVRPVADGKFLLDNPVKMAAEGAFNEVDVLIGALDNEGSVLAFDSSSTECPSVNYSSYLEAIGSTLGLTDRLTIDTVAFIYAEEIGLEDPDANYFSSVSKLVGDTMMLCDSVDMSRKLAKAGRKVYTYLMTHVPSHSIYWPITWLGATHAEDLPYVLGSPFMFDPDAETDITMLGRFGSQDEVQISLQVMKYWSNFAKTGNPNLSTIGEEPVASKYPVWPRYNHENPSYKELTTLFQNRAGNANAKTCYFLKHLLPTFLANSAEKARLSTLLAETVKTYSKDTCDDPTSCPEP